VTRHFQRWMRKINLAEKALCKAVGEMHQGLIDSGLLQLTQAQSKEAVEDGSLQEICRDQ